MPAFAFSELLQAEERINSGQGNGRKCLGPELQRLPGSDNFQHRSRTHGAATIQQIWAKETWLMWQLRAGEATTVAHIRESGQCHPGVAD